MVGHVVGQIPAGSLVGFYIVGRVFCGTIGQLVVRLHNKTGGKAAGRLFGRLVGRLYQ